MYLLDTNVISELRKPKPHAAVLEWLQNVPASSIFISAVTIGEIQTGIEITREQDLSKANELESWLNQIIARGQIISLDAECFKLWAKLKHRQSNTIYEDAMIAATAILLKLTVVTRNTKDFKRFKVQLLNPFET